MAFNLVLAIGIVALVLLVSIAWGFRVIDRRTQKRIDEVLDAVSRLKETLGAPGLPRALTATGPTGPLPLIVPLPASAPERRTTRRTAGGGLIIETEAGTVELDAEEAARVDQLAEVMGLDVADVVKRMVGAGLKVFEEPAAPSSDEEAEEEQTRVMGPGERGRIAKPQPGAPPVFPDLVGEEDERPTDPDAPGPESPRKK